MDKDTNISLISFLKVNFLNALNKSMSIFRETLE